jgi:hypothetical protein
MADHFDVRRDSVRKHGERRGGIGLLTIVATLAFAGRLRLARRRNEQDMKQRAEACHLQFIRAAMSGP